MSEKEKDNKGGQAGKGGAPKGGRPEGKGGKPAPKPAKDTGPAEPAGPAPVPRLKTAFAEQVRQKLTEQFGIKNVNAMPKLEKIVINVNMGRHIEGTKIPANVRSTVLDTLTKITGQKPVVCKAKKSVSQFKVREGLESSAMVTMRRERMWHFLDRLMNLATPRIRDFRGVPRESFDRQGNYSMGLTEQGVFPEINMADVTFTHGMHINICFSRSSPEKSRFVLEQLGMPFKKLEGAA